MRNLDGDCPKTALNAINVTYVRNVLSVIQAKIWPKKHFIQPNCIIAH
jgi:hypothetical protein